MAIRGLRHRIELQRATKTISELGTAQETWSTYKKVWASIKTSTGQEQIQGSQVVGTKSYTITIRYFATPLRTDRVLYNGHYFNIDDITNTDQRNRELVLSCKEKA